MISNKIKEIVKSRKNLIDKDYQLFKSLKVSTNREKRNSISQSIKKNKGVSIISEIKLASPTLGKIKNVSNVTELAKKMEKGGAVGLSVLTEPNYFDGGYENLSSAINSTNLPCLMKDFVIDEIQLKIASALGATNILLINSIINLELFYPFALKYGLEPLIEIHQEEEINDLRRLRDKGYNPTLIGVNNRDLKSLDIDISNSIKLIPLIKDMLGDDVCVISESGIHNYKDIQKLRSSGANGFLVGTSIMQADNITNKIQALRGII